jgi:aldose 1-epimerase
MSVRPSGDQFEIAFGEQRATVVEVGAGIREYVVGERPVLDPYPVDAICDGAHGAVLIPWPNRLADGRYRFDGAEYQVDVSEPDKRTAIHGLLRWRGWRAAERDAVSVRMATRLYPTPGYPFALDVTVGYALGADGLVVTTTATNIGDRAGPFGCGHHPYLSPGGGLIDACALQLNARTRILTDDERQLPVGREDVEGTPFDLRGGRVIGGQAIDHAFTELGRDGDGRAVVRLTARDGNRSELWVDRAYPFVEIFTGDTLAPERRRRGLGVEPMTCAPNAFNSGEGLIRLEPGSSVTATWGASLVAS